MFVTTKIMKKLLLILLCLPMIGFGQSKKALKEIVVQYKDTIVDLEEEMELYKTREIILKKKAENFGSRIETLQHGKDEILKELNQQEMENKELLNQKTTLKSSNTNLSTNIAVLTTNIDSLKNELSSHSCVEKILNNELIISTEHFLSAVYLRNKEIRNQEFILNFEGVVYQNRRETRHNYQDYNTKEFTYYDTEYLMKNELNLVLQPILDKNLGNTISEDEFNNSIYLYGNQFVNNRIDVNMLFPYFSFTKGKLLTINEKDYLFNISYDSIYTSGTLAMRFNLTDDNEKGYDIPCVLIDGRIYLRMDNEIMSLLDFPILLRDKLNFELQNNYYDKWDGISDYNLKTFDKFNNRYKDERTQRNTEKTLKWRCINETKYLSIFKKKTKFMKNDLLLNVENKDNYYSNSNSSLYLLFELIEK